MPFCFAALQTCSSMEAAQGLQILENSYGFLNGGVYICSSRTKARKELEQEPIAGRQQVMTEQGCSPATVKYIAHKRGMHEQRDNQSMPDKDMCLWQAMLTMSDSGALLRFVQGHNQVDPEEAERSLQASPAHCLINLRGQGCGVLH